MTSVRTSKKLMLSYIVNKAAAENSAAAIYITIIY